MGRRRKPWTRAQVRRVCESIYAGGYAAYRSRTGWSVWLSGDGAGPSRRRFFIPERVLSSRDPRWLSRRLSAAYRQALAGLDGVTMISGAESRDLLRWCTRRRRTRPQLTPSERARAERYRQWMRMAWRIPETVQGGGYAAERSRRGWVVRFSLYSGRLRGFYLVPFRALGPKGRDWRGDFLVAALEQALATIDGVVRTNDLKGSSPTGWPFTAKGRARNKALPARGRFRSPMAGETWTKRRAG